MKNTKENLIKEINILWEIYGDIAKDMPVDYQTQDLELLQILTEIRKLENLLATM